MELAFQGMELGGGQFQWWRHPFRGTYLDNVHSKVSWVGLWKSYQVGKNDAFEIPLSYVQHCQAQKNEVGSSSQANWVDNCVNKYASAIFSQVTLEFALNEQASVNLSELRFHIPSSEQQVLFVPFILCLMLPFIYQREV